MWFAGAHCDIGGGYPANDGQLWQEPFLWILREAETAGLVINPTKLGRVLGDNPPAKPWNEPLHESLKGAWWILECLLKRVGFAGWKFRWNCGRRRTINERELVHQSVMLRIRESDYSPANLPAAFLNLIGDLETVPPSLSV